MDQHRGLVDWTVERLSEAQLLEAAVADRYGVTFRARWFDAATGTLFCLADAPTRESLEAVHRETHGLVAQRTVRVVACPDRLWW